MYNEEDQAGKQNVAEMRKRVPILQTALSAAAPAAAIASTKIEDRDEAAAAGVPPSTFRRQGR